MEKNEYFIIIEKTMNNYSAYSPELLGCVATGKSLEEVKKNIYDAIEMHIEGLKEDNLEIPKPSHQGLILLEYENEPKDTQKSIIIDNRDEIRISYPILSVEKEISLLDLPQIVYTSTSSSSNEYVNIDSDKAINRINN